MIVGRRLEALAPPRRRGRGRARSRSRRRQRARAARSSGISPSSLARGRDPGPHRPHRARATTRCPISSTARARRRRRLSSRSAASVRSAARLTPARRDRRGHRPDPGRSAQRRRDRRPAGHRQRHDAACSAGVQTRWLLDRGAHGRARQSSSARRFEVVPRRSAAAPLRRSAAATSRRSCSPSGCSSSPSSSCSTSRPRASMSARARTCSGRSRRRRPAAPASSARAPTMSSSRRSATRVLIFAQGRVTAELVGTHITKQAIAERCYAGIRAAAARWQTERARHARARCRSAPPRRACAEAGTERLLVASGRALRPDRRLAPAARRLQHPEAGNLLHLAQHLDDPRLAGGAGRGDARAHDPADRQRLRRLDRLCHDALVDDRSRSSTSIYGVPIGWAIAGRARDRASSSASSTASSSPSFASTR